MHEFGVDLAGFEIREARDITAALLRYTDMTGTLPTIEFHRIREYNGTRHGGFEQLSVELFAREHGLSRQLIRVNGAGGDGGVEAYAEADDSRELAMQAKCFDQLGGTQWKQIDKSVKTALEQHPRLKEYRVYVPLDRTKGRLEETEGQVEEWNRRVARWRKLPHGADVEFVWQGAHEIGLALKTPRNYDLLFYWFGTPRLDAAWIDRVLQSSLKTLAERYQPDLHVDAHVGRELERFLWTPRLERELENGYVQVAEACFRFIPTLERLAAAGISAATLEAARRAIDDVVRIEYPVYGLRGVQDVRARATALRDLVEDWSDRLRTGIPRGADRDPHEHDRYSIDRFTRELNRWAYLLREHEDADRRFALVRGEAGSGKSHLLAHAAVLAGERGQPALLLLGESLLDSRPPLTQICEQIGWSGGPASLLGALNVAGSLAQRPALVIIDALNETTDRRLWKVHLHALTGMIEPYPHVRLIVSCRRDFIGITMPKDFKSGALAAGWGAIEHRGLGDVLAKVVARYFKSYQIRSSHFPPLLDEFRNPLFLGTFCRAFEKQTLPNGPITLQTVMEHRIARLAEKIQEDIDCDQHQVRRAISAIADRIRENQGRAVEREAAWAVIAPFSPSTEHSRSLYTHLLSSGVLVERVDGWWEDNPSLVVRFAFERFSDYFIAKGLLSGIKGIPALRRVLRAGGQLDWLRDRNGYQDNRGVARALAILVPEQFGLELIELLRASENREEALVDLLDSLPWRNGASIVASTRMLLRQASRCIPASAFIEGLLRVSTIPDHPFNATFLHERLSAMSVAGRDVGWTISVSDLAADRTSVPSTLVEWALQVPQGLVSDEQAALVGIALLWFGSSNRVGFRDRAGLAAIRLLRGRPHIMDELVRKFDVVNDPYVVERVYAVACGVAMREPPGDGLRTLANTVHCLVFATDDVRPHVLLRDYAQAILAIATNQGCLDSAIDSKSIEPPFSSKMPRVIGETRARAIEEHLGWDRIRSSVRPESMGAYGDFGRYVMGSATSQFLGYKRHDPVPVGPYWKNGFDDKRARRWVLQRVKALGWAPEMFGQYDHSLHDSRIGDRALRVERIGKKYQWIALHELLGYLTDHYHMRPDWNDSPRSYRAAWQIYARDFDPSADPDTWPRPSEDDEEEEETPEHRGASSWSYAESYADPFADIELLRDRAAWVRARPSDPRGLLVATRDNGTQRWLALEGFWNWRESRILGIRHRWSGRCEMWLHARSWMVLESDVEAFVKRIRQFSFGGHGCFGVQLGDGWIGEYPHGTAFEGARGLCARPDDWTQCDDSVHFRTTCHWESGCGAIVPSPQLCEVLGATWSGAGAMFCDPKGAPLATTASLPHTRSTPPCVVSEAPLRVGLADANARLVWAVLGERQCWDGIQMIGHVIQQFSGVYTLAANGIDGGLTIVEIVSLPVRDD